MPLVTLISTHVRTRYELCVLDTLIRTDTSGNDSKLPVPEEKVTNYQKFKKILKHLSSVKSNIPRNIIGILLQNYFENYFKMRI